MKRALAFLIALFSPVALAQFPATTPQGGPPKTSAIARSPTGTWLYANTDAFGNFFMNATAGASSPLQASGTNPPPGALVGLSPSGSWLYLNTDNNGNLYVNCTTGCASTPSGPATNALAGSYPGPSLAPLTAVTGAAFFANLTGCTTAGYVFTAYNGTCTAQTGGGNVSNSGTPTSGQVAIWTSSVGIQGVTTPAISITGNAGTATSVAGGATGSAPYQSAAATTAFIASPTTSGHTFVYAWQPTGSAIAPASLDLATYLASPPAIGSTTAGTGKFSTLTDTGLTGSTQCVQVNSSGLFSGTGSACGTGSGSGVWSALTAPSGNLSLAMTTYTTGFTWGATSGTSDLMSWTDGGSDTGTGLMAHFHTASGSSEVPWQADSNGVGWQVNTSGNLVSVGSTSPGVLSLGASGTVGQVVLGNATSGTVTLGTVAGALGTVTASLPANTGTIAELNLAQTFSAVQTISAASGLVLSAMTGTACLEEISGVVTSTGSACGGGSGLPSSTGGQTYFSNAGTGAATSAIYVGGAAVGSQVGINQTAPIASFETSGIYYQDAPYTGTAAFNGSCASTVTSPSTCAITGGLNLPPQGVILADFNNGSGTQEFICYSAVTSTTITPGGGNCATTTGNNGRAYWGTTAGSHNAQIAAVVYATPSAANVLPAVYQLGNSASGSYAIGAANPNQFQNGPGIILNTNVQFGGAACLNGFVHANNQNCMSTPGGGFQYLDGNGNVSIQGQPGTHSYVISAQNITATSLTPITNTTTQALPQNSNAGGAISTRCTIIWNQATSGTVKFGVITSGLSTATWVKEQDSPGAYVAPVYTTITTAATTQTSGTITPTAYGTTYSTDIWITMEPNTANSNSIQLAALVSANTLTIEPGTGCTGWF